MTDRLSAAVLATASARAETAAALADCFDDVTAVAVADVDPESPPDCLLVVAPGPDDGAWDRFRDLRRRFPDRPLLALATADGETSVRDRLADLRPTDVVVADAPDRHRRFADRVRGAVSARRAAGDSAADDAADAVDDAADPGGFVRALYDVATDASLDFETKADRILELGVERLGVENAHLSTIDRGLDRYEVVASVGTLPMEPGDLMEFPETFCRRTVESEEVLAISHAGEQGWADDPAYEPGGIECYLGSRITVGGSLFGTVCFLDHDPHEAFTEAERSFVSLVARWLSHELERTRREAALDALTETTRELLGATTREAVCDLVATGAGRITDALVARTWLVDETGQRLRLASGADPAPPRTTVSRQTAADHHLWSALAANETRRYDGDDATARAAAVRDDGPVRSLLVLPLGDAGVLEVAAEAESAFDAIEVSTLETLVSGGVAALDRAAQQAELAAAHERFQRIFESANDALLLLDPVGDEIVECNSRACALLGYDRDDLLDASPTGLHADTADRYRSFVDDVQRTGSGWTEELRMRRRDGHRFPVETSAALVDLPERTCLLASVRDVTERRRREQALQVFNRVLRHNLRNEMNVVIGQAQLLDATIEEPTGHERVGEIIDRAKAILSLGEKARLFQQLDDEDDDASAVDIRTVVERVRESVLAEHPAANVVIEGSRALAKVDSTIDTALAELVENAIQHADHASPTVTVAVESGYTDEQFALDVRDDGPGLPDGDRAVVDDGTETPLQHGSGLGLWIANWVVENNGGSMTVVESGPDGTTMRLLLPTAPASDVEGEDRTPPGESDAV